MNKFNNESQIAKDGFNKIHDSITRCKNMNQLTKAVEASLQIIKDCHIDAYNVGRLEQYGMKKYEQILIEERRLESTLKNNKFKK